LYASPDIVRVIRSRRMRWEGHVTRMGHEKCINILATRKISCRWEDNIKMDLGKKGGKVWDWTHLAQDWGQWWAVVNKVMNLGVP